MIKRTNNELQNTTLKTKDGATRTQLKTGGELMCSEKVNSSCSTNVIRRVTLVTNPVISYEWGKDRNMFTTNEHSYGSDRKTLH